MTLPVRTKSARMEADRQLIDAGSGPGALELLGTGSVVRARVTLQKPCGSTGGTDTLTLTPPAATTALTVGDIASARVVDSDGTLIRPLTVGTANAEVILSKLTVAQVGESVSIQSATFKHPA